jgi:hypothetical protein
MRHNSSGESAKDLTQSADERAERAERTLDASRKQARRTDATMTRTANTLESVMDMAEASGDPSIMQRLKGIVDYLRTSETASENPLLERLREPARVPMPNGRHDP